jgi:hypothetical protein
MILRHNRRLHDHTRTLRLCTHPHVIVGALSDVEAQLARVDDGFGCLVVSLVVEFDCVSVCGICLFDLDRVAVDVQVYARTVGVRGVDEPCGSLVGDLFK